MTEHVTSPVTNKVTVTSGRVAYAKSTIFPVKPEAKAYPRTSVKRGESGEAGADKATPADEFISELTELYEFRDDLVESFLQENPSLVSLLFEAYKIVPSHFGAQIEMALEVVADPESPEDKELFVVIRTNLPSKEARTLLAELDRGWWRNASLVAQGKMELDIE